MLELALLLVALRIGMRVRNRLLRQPAIAWVVGVATRTPSAKRVAAGLLAGTAAMLVALRWWFYRNRDKVCTPGPQLL